ncbi:MAG: MoxR family ATPase [Betaproteobacteria bacterium]|nr:MoxR family ATPase [Betaproteobacteria bacterium]
MTAPPTLPVSIDDTLELLAGADYIADRALATTIFLALRLERPLFLEGEAGVGKTEISKALSLTLERPLVRLQCYEGLDIHAAVYEWNVQRQMIAIRMAESSGAADALARDIYSDAFLIRRPLLQAIELARAGTPPVLLIDELDRSDEPFEAYLLEVLSDFQVSIPELGTIACTEPPIVVLTSNRTREIHDAVKRRCLYHWVDFPDAGREWEIVLRRIPGVPETLSREAVEFVQRLRGRDLFKLPGVAETIDWTRALMALDQMVLDPKTVNDTLGALLKYQDDIARIQGSEAAAIVAEVQARIAAQ